MTMIYDTQVVNVGAHAEDFKSEAMIILFGQDAPQDLADYCYNIEVVPVEGSMEVGMQLLIDDHAYSITAIGDLVEKNLSELGHITIKFDGQSDADLPGTLHVSDQPIATIHVGSRLQIK